MLHVNLDYERLAKPSMHHDVWKTTLDQKILYIIEMRRNYATLEDT